MKKTKWVIGLIGIVVIVFIVVLLLKVQHHDHTEVKQTETVKRVQNIPKPKHIVIVVGENHSYNQIIGASDAPYINELAQKGVLFTNSHGIAHPSQPNYLALFSGDTQGITDDSCPHTFSSNNLAVALKKKGNSFAGYSEDLPSVGFKGCQSHSYHRKHSPWVNFSNVSSSANLPFTSFPKNYSQLPTISFVIPNLMNDMHDGTVKQADTWLKKNLDSYIQWAYSNDSLFILTWDEDNFKKPNQIPTIFVGPMVKPGKYNTYMDHYSVLRTIEDMYGITPMGKTVSTSAIKGIWK